VQGLVAANNLTTYQLIVNGGEHHEFPHLHIHLVSDNGKMI